MSKIKSPYDEESETMFVNMRHEAYCEGYYDLAQEILKYINNGATLEYIKYECNKIIEE